MKYFCSWSGGVDSTATGVLAVLNNEPLDVMVYATVMFDKETPADLPEHYQFLHEVAFPWFRERGIKVAEVRSNKNFVDDYFYFLSGPKSKYCGKYRGFPLVGRGGCEVKRFGKVQPVNKYIRENKDDRRSEYITYIGYAADERRRLATLKDNQISLLAKYGVSHNEAIKLCEKYGLKSPYYDYSKRGGCFFCPNANDSQLMWLKVHHPELWNKLLSLQSEPNIIRPGKFRVHEGLFEIDKRLEGLYEENSRAV